MSTKRDNAIELLNLAKDNTRVVIPNSKLNPGPTYLVNGDSMNLPGTYLVEQGAGLGGEFVAWGDFEFMVNALVNEIFI